jgi:hypothetical protein
MTGKMVLTYLHQLDPGIPIDLICRRLYDYSIIGRSNLDPSTAGVAALSLLVPGQQGGLAVAKMDKTILYNTKSCSLPSNRSE